MKAGKHGCCLGSVCCVRAFLCWAACVRWLELKVAASQQVWEVTGSVAYEQKALNKQNSSINESINKTGEKAMKSAMSLNFAFFE